MEDGSETAGNHDILKWLPCVGIGPRFFVGARGDSRGTSRKSVRNYTVFYRKPLGFHRSTGIRDNLLKTVAIPVEIRCKLWVFNHSHGVLCGFQW